MIVCQKMQKLDKGDPPLMDLFNDCFFIPPYYLALQVAGMVGIITALLRWDS